MASIANFGLDVGIYGPLADPPTILGLAQHAEATGFESIWLADHIAFPVTYTSEYPYSAKGDFPTKLDDPLMEPLATLGVLVGATKRVRIGTAVLVLPQRNPIVVAPEMRVSDAVLIMIERGFRHLPVVGPGAKILGVFSVRDALPREIGNAVSLAEFNEQVNDALG